MEIKIKTYDVSLDFRDDVCAKCGHNCHPRVRVSYYSPLLKDEYGNNIIDDEFIICDDCRKKLHLRISR